MTGTVTDVLDARSTRIEHLSAIECWSILAGSPLGRVATVGPEGIELLPVNHAVDRHRIVLRTEADGWLHDAADGRELVFEVDGWDEHSAWSVVVRGTARPLELADEVHRASRLGIQAWAPIESDVFLELEPAGVTGRRIARRHRGEAPWYW
jgi:nitroimidazol reductase NimA-like FMN-containing flavoprotein (pyridoxamine 5'-phosphate oxidase superfamily)